MINLIVGGVVLAAPLVAGGFILVSLHFANPNAPWGFAGDDFLYGGRDDAGNFVLSGALILRSDNLDYLLAVLNSRLVLWYASKNFALLGGEAIRWKKKSVETIPIPRATPAEQQVLVELAQELTRLHRRREQIPAREIARVRTLDAQITTADDELNRRVEDLYSLTEAERSYYRAEAQH